MSYAGPASRGNRALDVEQHRTPVTASRLSGQGEGAAPRHQPSFADRGAPLLFAAGVALGVVVGAGAALLLAPRAGADTRRSLVRQTRRLGHRSHDAWDDLRDELRRAVRLRRRAWRRRRAQHDDLATAD